MNVKDNEQRIGCLVCASADKKGVDITTIPMKEAVDAGWKFTADPRIINLLHGSPYTRAWCCGECATKLGRVLETRVQALIANMICPKCGGAALEVAEKRGPRKRRGKPGRMLEHVKCPRCSYGKTYLKMRRPSPESIVLKQIRREMRLILLKRGD